MPQGINDPKLLVGLNTGDDAAVYKLDEKSGLVFTLDFFPPVVDDPFHYGAIAAANSLSDIYAMGGTPLMALNIVGFPADLPKSILGDILRGGHSKALEAGCIVAGGHTINDKEPKYGMAVIGTVKPGNHISNAGSRPGDRLILTKPLGTGIITTAAKNDAVSQQVLEKTIGIMSTLNDTASRLMVSIGVNAATDVTGFGLIGHLKNMMIQSKVSARIRASNMPIIDGVRELINGGFVPGGTHRNLEDSAHNVEWSSKLSVGEKLLLSDSQTSGGLLISVPEQNSRALLEELHYNNVIFAAIIGEVYDSPNPGVQVMP